MCVGLLNGFCWFKNSPKTVAVQRVLHITLVFPYSLACLAVQFTSLLEQLESLQGTGVVVRVQQTDRL